MTTKYIAVALIALIVAGGVYGGYKFLFTPAQPQLTAASPNGTTFSTAKVAAINYTPSSSAASSTSLLNTSANTWYITDSFVYCSSPTGNGGTFEGATTTVPNEGLQANVNYGMNDVGTTTTTSGAFNIASSTEGVITYISRAWPAGTYFTILDSTVVADPITGTCTVGVHYLSS